jgi:hypothetical protein
VGIQYADLTGSQDLAQLKPGCEIAPATEDQRHHREISQTDPTVQLSAVVDGKDQPVAALPHSQGFYENTALLSAPAQGGFGMEDKQ